ncbi:Ribosomal protein S18 acetylase RimI [Psychrobacillus sp. OK028]|uniref:GNAT family N-acetyltransferase n=1 Tax=Psychrobacillus sp. OK028 TaxID=1884359 RepID=UPI00088D182D|nr:N-acetyltransferase [Psychrobacillus sp. OK028]SDN09248.1 Ribosomal protein S18 acetylase RimI [Psychrobacillus sp. OK028]
MTLYISNPKNLERLAAFLEIINKDDSFHIGYCGEDKKEIYDTLSNDFSDIDMEKSFVVAYDKDNIVGALGFDIDEENKSAEVWGPFVQNGEDYSQIANVLWQVLEDTIPFKLNEYMFFVNEKNTLAKQFIEHKNGRETGHHLILSADRTSLTDGEDIHIKNYDPIFHKSFSALHHLAFPNTYYNSEQILSRISDDNRLFIIQHNNKIKGYVYVEAIPLHGEGTIEYIAVYPDFRGSGIATNLMRAALHHLFSYEAIEEITLSVGANNKAAIALYMTSGFQLKHTLVAYKR